MTPRATSFPSAMAGEERGPGWAGVGSGDGVGGVFVGPELGAVGSVEAGDGFVGAVAGEDVEFVGDDGDGGIGAEADFGGPLGGELFGPGGGGFEVGDFAVAGGAAPLGPVGGGGGGEEDGGEDRQECCRAFHEDLLG